MDPALSVAMNNLSLTTTSDPTPGVLMASVEHVVTASAEAVAMAAAIITSAVESAPATMQANTKPDLNLPKGVGTRDECIPSLNGRMKDVSVRPVAEGGYSNVWKGTLDEDTPVAIKCLRDKTVQEAKAKRRLRREVGAWWCLKHENIVPLLGTTNEEKFGASPAMVSPWYKNGTALAYLDPKNSVSMSQRVELFQGVAKGIHYLHTFNLTKIKVGEGEEQESCGIKLVHGDLKPLNVLVDDNGAAKICDFGLLRLVRESAPTGMTTTSSHTGTIRYLSYELISEDEEDAKPTTASDVYALACIGMEFIYGKPPHAKIPDTGSNPGFKIMNAIDRGKPPAVRPPNCTGVVSGLWDLFEACWSRDAVHRPDAATICRYLEENKEKLIAEL